ncbi:recombinase family protein [Dactylosporangium darangshiense]|uniref:recombinase family protein n=1 Tax=Dactylosporangium darangshiense TaxID=579108 RepID=UPI003626E96E
MQRIFAMFITGYGLYVIAEQFARDGIPCPSAYDRVRNRHRSGIAWSKSAVRTILKNPRYTGFQVWNKQRTDEILLDVDDVAMGHTSVMRWNDRDRWVQSDVPGHPAIIDRDIFDQAQAILARRGDRLGGPRQQYRSRHPYLFKGAVYCAVCERKMQGQHSHGVGIGPPGRPAVAVRLWRSLIADQADDLNEGVRDPGTGERTVRRDWSCT